RSDSFGRCVHCFMRLAYQQNTFGLLLLNEVMNKCSNELSFAGTGRALEQRYRPVIHKPGECLSLLRVETDFIAMFVFAVISGKVRISYFNVIVCGFYRTSRIEKIH